MTSCKIFEIYYSFTLIYLYSMYYTLWAFEPTIFCIVNDFGVLGVVQEI